MADKTSSVLERMTADVVNRKRRTTTPQEPSEPAQGTQTPLAGGNGQGAPESEGLEVTGNITQTRAALLESLARIEQEVSNARFMVELLFQPLRVPAPVTPASIDEDRKKAEAEADRRAFERDMKAKSEAAQAATFQPEADGWVCPEHGKSSWQTSPKGRKYLACPDCGEFERAR